MGCLWCIQTPLYILPQSLKWCMQYHVKSDSVITASNCITWSVWLSLWWFLQCIKNMHRFAQCTEIWKKCQNSVIHISCNHNGKICNIAINMDCLNYLNLTMQLFSNLYLTQLIGILIWNTINFIEITKPSDQYNSYLHIFAFLFCVHLVTLESL